jgi:GTP-binding protein
MASSRSPYKPVFNHNVNAMQSYYQQAKFTQSATTLNTLPPEFGFEIAFAGRSNAGKSSTLNRVCSQKSLARTSKTPGRTQLINFFGLPEGRNLVDLPGYGYAKVPEHKKHEWSRFIEAYLSHRFTLKGLILIMDIRHPFREHDQQLLSWANARNLAVHVVLNKADKLKKGAAKSTWLKIQNEVRKINPDYSAQMFSALNNAGIEILWDKLDEWLLIGKYQQPDNTSEDTAD